MALDIRSKQAECRQLPEHGPPCLFVQFLADTEGADLVVTPLRYPPGLIAAALMTFAPPNETSSTTPSPLRSTAAQRFSPRRENAHGKGAETR